MNQPITIIGGGRFGSYFKRLLTDVGEDVATIDLGSKQPEFDRLAASKIVVFAVPIRYFENALNTFSPHVAEGATVMDVCSVKVWPAFLLSKAFDGRLVSAVATHPLFGPQSAPKSAAGQRVAYSPIRTVEGEGFHKILPLFEKLQLDVILCDPHDHDLQMARSQVLNHFLGRAAELFGMSQVVMSTKTHTLFMDIVKIISGNSYDLFEDMNVFNPYAHLARTEFMDALHEVDKKLRHLEIENPAGRRVMELARAPLPKP